MVKYKSLLDKYCCSSLEGKENRYYPMENFPDKMKSNLIIQEQTQQEVSKIKDRDHYIPSWRAACDAWVSEKVEDKVGVHTPVYLLYNAYIKDNPDDYMDIGQFGKVLRSRFPYRKRRRGKQGQQVYVYQDVALKSAGDEKPQVDEVPDKSKSPSKGRTSPGYYPQGNLSAAGPSIVVRNDTGGRLLSPPHSISEVEARSPNSSPSKRKDHERDSLQLSPGSKRLKTDNGNEFDNLIEKQSELDQTSSSDEKYANASLCRMAIGRRWIDSNLLDVPGYQTYAKDIMQAYTEDQPSEPLTFTSLALLIRGKYPGRRKKVTVGPEAEFLYEGLKLNRPQSNPTEKTHKQAASTSNTENLYELRTVNTAQNILPSSVVYSSAVPVSSRTTTSTTVPSNSRMSYIMPPVFPIQSTSHTQGVPVGRVMPQSVPTVLSGTSYMVAQGSTSTSNLSALQKNVPKPIPSTSCRSSPASEQYRNKRTMISDSEKAMLGVKQNRRLSSPQNVAGPDAHQIKKKHLQVKLASVDMDVGEYLESELLDINDLGKTVSNYIVSIKVPTINQGITHHEIPYGQITSPISQDYFVHEETKTDFPPNPAKSGIFPLPESDEDNSQCSFSSVREFSSFNNQEMPVVKNMPCGKNLNPNRTTWDYEMRKSLSPDPARNWDLDKKEIRNSEQADDMQSNYIHKKIKGSRLKGAISKTREQFEGSSESTYQDTNHTNENSVSQYAAVQQIPMNLSMDNLSLENKERTVFTTLKGNGGSPTSTSPPGAAMHRLEEEITTSTPQVGEQQPLVYTTSTASSEVPSTSKDSSSRYDPQFVEILKSLMSTARKSLTDRETLVEPLLKRSLEGAVIEENPAVLYDELKSCGDYPCSVTPALKELELRTPEETIELIRHHQSCSGLGCTKECRMLRAAYIHIALFQHKCNVWSTFYKIIAKHSKRCRFISCGVEFCHFVKHELHLTGVSVLPMQLLKERPFLEEDFKKCEKIGTHEGSLHCRHHPRSRLPALMNPASRQQLTDIQQTKDTTTTTSMQDHDILALTISSRFPDTPNGNTLAVHVTKAVDLVRELFKKQPDVR